MGANELLSRIQDLLPDKPIDWKAIREEIHNEFDRANTADERAMLLAIYKAVMDAVERNIPKSDTVTLEQFRNTRLVDYRLLLTKEALVGENVCADTLYAITERELAAGRLSPDDELRLLAAKRIAEPHPTRAEMVALAQNQKKGRGILRQIFGS